MSRKLFFIIFWAVALTSVGFAQKIGPNVNVFQSPVTPGDPVARQVESDITASLDGRLLAVAIDYRQNTTGWCAWAYSRNGKVWTNRLFKGYPGDPQGASSPLSGSDKCGDPVATTGVVPSGGGYISKYFVGGLASLSNTQ